MSEELLEIDNTKTQDENEEEDLIEVRISHEKHFKVNFSKLVSQSKHVRDKYKYSEAINSISDELSQLQKTTGIKETSIEHFLKYIQEGKVTIRSEYYYDIYKLSKYFQILRLTRALDKIYHSKLCADLNFSIDTLIYSEHESNEIENDFIVKIENFLSERINESLSNNKFGQLPVSNIYRIVEKCDKKRLNVNVLNEFIFESIEKRFVLLKFVDLHKIQNENLFKFIQFFEEQETTTKEKYFEYMPFNLSFIKEILKKYDDLLNLFNKTKDEIKQTKDELKQTKDELKQTKEELKETKEELKQTKDELKEKERKIEKIEKSKEESNRIKSVDKQIAKSIVAAGLDCYNQLGVNPNNRDKYGNCRVIHPPQKLPVEPSSLLSYSSYYRHTFLITRSGSLQGVGYNEDCRISNTLQKTVIKQFSEISMNDRDGQPLVPVSVVCGYYSTLFMISRKSGSENQLVFCDISINGWSPVFLDIGNKQPLSLFGGYFHSAAISIEGEVIFINRDSVRNSPSARIESSSLPNSEKARSVACGRDRVIAQSSSGEVFSSKVESNSSALKFSRVEELSGKEIVWVSGTLDHFFAVSKEGRVFGCGSNSDGRLGLGKGKSSVSEFAEISSLFGYEIRSAYAGYCHSLFLTREGKILSCGYNDYGQLLLSSGPSDPVYSPKETTITSGATFCIAGDQHSVVFIGGDPPPNTPNMPIDFNKQ